jgi:hypothetical protein
LADHHLKEIYDIISQALFLPPHSMKASTFCKDVLLPQSRTARLNRGKYLSVCNVGDDAGKGQHWLKALLRYRLKQYSLTLGAKAWQYDLTDDGTLFGTLPSMPSTPEEAVLPLPPWRLSSAASASSAGQQESGPPVKKSRTGK